MFRLPDTNSMRIAIIGAGISGLTAALALDRDHDVTVFEAGAWIGGHTHTIDVEVDGRPYAVDTGFIVFNTRHYPRFTELLDALGVASQPTDMSFSVRSDRTGREWNSASASGILAQPLNALRPSFLRMLSDVVRFNRLASSAPLPDDRTTVEAWTRAHGLGDAFLDEYLIPLGASLWSSPPRRFREFSMRFVIEFLHNHAMLQVKGQPVWRVVRGGSQRYVDALVDRLRAPVRVRTPIVSVGRRPDAVVVREATGATATFDHVVLACHADQALRLLEDASPVEREVVGAFGYQPNDVLLHTDDRVLPRSRRAWASWNYHVAADDRDAVSVTYNMNRLQGLDAPVLFNVTLNDSGLVRPDRVLARFTYEHPVFAPGRDAAQRRHAEVVGVNRTSFCGAYWGFGFHEDGVRSGLAVAEPLLARMAA